MTERAQLWREGLERARRVWRCSVLPGFLAWWRGELVACVPRRWVAWWGRSTEWYVITLDDDDLQVYRAGAHAPACCIRTTEPEALQQSTWRDAVAGSNPHDLRVALCLKPHQVLRRALTLPAAAGSDLIRVLGYEMDRQTPFGRSDVAYAAHDLGRTRDGRLRVELVAVPTARLDPMLVRLHALRIDVDAVDALEGTHRLGVNMLDVGARPRHPFPRRRLNIMLAAVAAVLLVLSMGLWLHNRRATLATMRVQVDALRGRAQQVAALRQRLIERTGAAGFLGRQRVMTPAVITVLADLTQRLPDDTWLERLNIDASGRVSLQGESLHATQLLKRVDASPYLDDPGFQGAIQTDTQSGKERFYMTAKLRVAGTTGQSAHAALTAEDADAPTDAH